MKNFFGHVRVAEDIVILSDQLVSCIAADLTKGVSLVNFLSKVTL